MPWLGSPLTQNVWFLRWLGVVGEVLLGRQGKGRPDRTVFGGVQLHHPGRQCDAAAERHVDCPATCKQGLEGKLHQSCTRRSMWQCAGAQWLPCIWHSARPTASGLLQNIYTCCIVGCWYLTHVSVVLLLTLLSLLLLLLLWCCGISGEGRRPPMGDRPPRGPPREGGYREGYRSGPREGGGFGRGGGGDKVRAAGLRHSTALYQKA